MSGWTHVTITALRDTEVNIVNPILFQCRQNAPAAALCAPGAFYNVVSYARLEHFIHNVTRAAARTREGAKEVLWRLRRATIMETGLFEIQADHLSEFRQARHALLTSQAGAGTACSVSAVAFFCNKTRALASIAAIGFDLPEGSHFVLRFGSVVSRLSRLGPRRAFDPKSLAAGAFAAAIVVNGQRTHVRFVPKSGHRNSTA
jgi:hypothetical protein